MDPAVSSTPPSLPSAQRLSNTPVLFLIFGVVVGLLLIACLGWFVWRITQPREYYSQAVIEVADDGYDHWQFSDLDAVARSLQRSEILLPVSKALNLPSDETALDRLRGALRIRHIKDTTRIQIGAISPDRLLAANIANTIAVTYRQQQMLLLQAGMERAISQFTDEVLKQREQVEDRAHELELIRARDHINDPDPTNPQAKIAGDHPDFVEAKTKYLQDSHILANAEVSLSKAKQGEFIFIEPVKIIERAVPAQAPLPWWKW